MAFETVAPILSIGESVHPLGDIDLPKSPAHTSWHLYGASLFLKAGTLHKPSLTPPQVRKVVSRTDSVFTFHTNSTTRNGL